MIHLQANGQWRGFVLLLFISTSMLIKGQRLAAQKCDEYRKITLKTNWLITLIADATPIEVKSSECSNVVKLIVGGEEAVYGEFPHHALLGFPQNESKLNFDFRCGGTLISYLHVMTAAHCFGAEQPTIVRLGEYDTSFPNGHEYEEEIAAIRKHPHFKNSRPYHDIALVKLAKRIYPTLFIRPACLWDTEQRNFTKYIATGFGYNETYRTVLSTLMMKVQLEEFPVEDCAKQFKNSRHFPRGIQDGQLCVGSKVEGRDTCPGDSGGPLQTVTHTRSCMYHVVGIISTGSWCGVGAAKAIYTKVSHYIDWIEDNVWGPNAL